MRLLGLACLLVVGGCPHSDDPPFVDAAADARRDAPIDAMLVDRPASQLADINGTFLVAIHVGFETTNDPALFVQLVVTWTLTFGPRQLDGAYLPLCTHPSCAERSSIPPTLDTFDAPVAEDGIFEQLIVGRFPGSANPFHGKEEFADITFHAVTFDADLVCGTVTGSIGVVNLAGSTFAALRTLGTSPSDLPSPLAACPVPI